MMSDGSLSQEEIDALLESGSDVNVSQAGLAHPGIEQERLHLFEDLLQSIIPNQKKILNKAINARSNIEFHSNALADLDSISGDIGESAVQIVRNVAGADKSEILFLISEKDALQAATYIIGQEDLEVNDLLLGALQEMVISISEPILQDLGTRRGAPIEIESNSSNHLSVADINLPNSPAVITTYTITIKSRAIRLYMTLDPSLLDQISPPQKSVQSTTEAGAHQTATHESARMPAMAPASLSRKNEPALRQQVAPSTVSSARFNPLNEMGLPRSQGNLGLLMDVEMELTVELGRTHRQVREILQMGEGSIIELDKLAGEPVDILVNRRPIAKGEVVVIDENFGVRITEVITPLEQLTDV